MGEKVGVKKLINHVKLIKCFRLFQNLDKKELPVLTSVGP